MPIHHLALSKSVRTGIVYGADYESIDACIAAHMDVERWLTGRVNLWVMKKVLAWHRLKTLIGAHSDEAGAEQVERDRKKRKFK